MSIITESELRSFRHRRSNKVQSYSRPLAGIGSPDHNRSVFLSHKHTDISLVGNLKNLLSKFDILLYVDWLDRSMPIHTSATTANQIKKRIDQCDKFMFLATDEAIDSRWCNWEIGVADILKSQYDKMVLFPIKKGYRDWGGAEYMQLYPTIEKQEGYNKNTKGKYIAKGFYVFYPSDKNGRRTYKPLVDWLQLS